jgi:alkanesulfonate monooxygenase SsuD/methylene tetrahydromethanopterin reductase-like flavin-dependent oxidoreductase (luciferase family)
VRFSINIPNFGDFADANVVARVASEAETAGWDALFVWDHVVHHKNNGRSFGDPWMLLTAAALATERIKLGTLVTPVARRRPQQLARQVATLDNLSRGRVISVPGSAARSKTSTAPSASRPTPSCSPSAWTKACTCWTGTGRASR